MELLYIWIEDYKNIKKQGFNFSPKYRFEYDSDKSELKMDERENAIDNFFGDGVSNVTAIVGENGAGKTTLLQLLSMLPSKDSDYFNKKPNGYVVAILNDDNELIAETKIDITVNSKKNITIKKSDEKLFSKISPIVYSHVFTNQKEIFGKNSIDITSNNLKRKSKKDTNHFDSVKIMLNDIPRQCDFILNNNKLLPFKAPEYLRIEFKFAATTFCPDALEHINSFKEDDLNFKTKDELQKFLCESIGIDKKVSHGNPVYNFILRYIMTFDNGTEIKKYLNALNNYNINKDTQYLTRENHNSIPIEPLINITNKKIIKREEARDVFLVSKQLFDKYMSFNFFDAEWLNKDDSESMKLSTGELFFLEMFTRLYSVGEHLSKEEKLNLLIFFDEIDVGLHPRWQRIILKTIIDALPELFGKNHRIQVVFTSHSPFIVSDLPKNNILFLKKDKTENEDYLDDIKQTFGANIHTLLSSSFFMKDGLMGEFAKSKIDDVIKFLNNDKNSKLSKPEDAQKVINIIGEPIMKHILQKQLDNLQPSKDIIIKELEARVKELEFINQSKIENK